MQYSEEFKQKVLSLLGDDVQMRQRLDQGDMMVGRFLDDARQTHIPAQEIVTACETMNFQEIYQKAKKQVTLENLYSEWLGYQNQNQNENQMHM